jgi:hypothetical protein
MFQAPPRAHDSGNTRCDRGACIVIESDPAFPDEISTVLLFTSRMAIATMHPDEKVTTAIVIIAAAKPNRSAIDPAESAPIA